MNNQFSKMETAELSDLVGKNILKIVGLNENSDEVTIFTECGKEYLFYHDQDCCESVYLCDFECDEEFLRGATILSSELTTNEGTDGDENPPEYHDGSWTWSFYKIETSKGELFMRWVGESNGYYSESVDFVLVKHDENLK